jgi:fused signal recognition particle receptor
VFEKLKAGLSGLVSKVTTTELKADQLNRILSDFKISLIENDVALPVAERICDELESRLEGAEVSRLEDRKQTVKESLREALLQVLETDRKVDLLAAAEEKKKKGEPLVVAFVGINGTGKTTSIAKIVRIFQQEGCSVVLASSDTYRAGSIEQLEEHARRLGVRLIKHRYGADPAAVAFDAVKHAQAHGVNAVLIDTAGRIQTDKNLMNELAKVKRIIGPDLTLLVVDALTGNDAVVQAEEFNERIGVDATILTKVDADVKGGSALSVTYVTRRPILYIGTGQEYTDLQPFNSEQFIDLMLAGIKG